VTANATANGVAGTYTVAVVGSTTGFQLTNTAGPAAGLTVVTGGGQTAPILTPFAASIVFQVTDATGNVVSGTAITLTGPGVGASATFSPLSPVTGGNGQATVVATANAVPGGPYVVTARAGSFGTTFDLENLGPPSKVTVVSGGGQGTPIDTTFGSPIAVLVEDMSGHAIRGATVTLAAPATGASAAFLPLPAITDAGGVALITATANDDVGAYTVTVASGSATASFQLTNVFSAAAAPTHGSGCRVAPGGRGDPFALLPFASALAAAALGRLRRSRSARRRS
jgi:hypothetical protein